MDTVSSFETHCYTDNTKGKIHFSAYCIGGRNWSLKDFYDQNHAYERRELANRLRWELTGIGAKRAFGPTPVKFNGVIVTPDKLETCIRLGSDLTLFRNKDVHADGTLLHSLGDAGIISAGGCPMMVASHRGSLVFAHAGRDCLIDRTWIDSDGKVKGRPHESVADSVIQALREDCPRDQVFSLNEVEAWIFWSIPAKRFLDKFDDETWGARNRKTADYVLKRFGTDALELTDTTVGYDLPTILREQLMTLGVPSANIRRHENEYLPKEFPTTRDSNDRYLLAVVRTRQPQAASPP